MASRKEQKDLARQQRVAQEQARADRVRRSQRLRMLAGVLIGAAIVIVVAIVISSNGSNPIGPGPSLSGRATERLVDAELAGVPQSGAQLGNPAAPVTAIYYGDLECPYCAALTTGQAGGGLPALIANQVRHGQVKVEYRSFCTATCNDYGQALFNAQQVAALAAGMQNKFWYYTELFYHEQHAEGSGYVTPAFLNMLARQTPGLNIAKWQADQKDPNLLAQVELGEADATAASLQGTPTIIIKGLKGEQIVNAVSGVPSYSELEQTINQVR